MKSKVISGVLAAVFGITMLCLQFTPAFSIAIAFFTFFANYELMHTSGNKNKGIYILTSIPAIAMPFVLDYDLLRFLPVPPIALLLVYMFLLCIMMLKTYEKTRFDQVSMALVSSLLIPYLISTLITIRDIFPEYPKSTRGYLVLLTLLGAWITDTMAYFSGSMFGKHKMAPRISPKKTWEGAIGGVIGTVLVNVIVFGIYSLLAHFGLINKLMIPLWIVPIISVVLSIAGMLGDLSASVIKRNYGVKDYGTIMGKGNGGVMDRFDSAVFVIGAMYIILHIYSAIIH